MCEKQSQLRSLSSGLEAHGGGVDEARRGRGWNGWREEGGKLSPEATQASKINRPPLILFGGEMAGAYSVLEELQVIVVGKHNVEVDCC